jgi:hypothetical protein
VPRAALVERGSVAEQDEVGMHSIVDELETVASEVPLEKHPGLRLRFGQEQCRRHATERTAAPTAALDVLSHESVTNDRHAAF